jgi:hypothetical protein
MARRADDDATRISTSAADPALDMPAFHPEVQLYRLRPDFGGGNLSGNRLQIIADQVVALATSVKLQ